MKVLTIGATGEFAGMIVPELVNRGVTVRALVRDEKKAVAAHERGASETIIGDLSDPQSLRKAAESMDGVFHISPGFAPDEAAWGVSMVEAAEAAGVKKFVFSGVIHPSLSKLVNHSGKRPVEEALYESGLDFTVLQPTMFMQNMEKEWSEIVKSGKVTEPYSKNVKVSYVDYRDVAEAAAIAMTSDKLSYGTFELCARGMVTRIDIAAMMTEASGKKIEAAEIAVEEWLKYTSIPGGPLRKGLAIMYDNYNTYGFPGGNALVLEAILGREPRSLKDYIKELATQSSSK